MRAPFSARELFAHGAHGAHAAFHLGIHEQAQAQVRRQEGGAVSQERQAAQARNGAQEAQEALVPAPMDDARATLLRALEELEGAVGELEGELERADVVVIYSVGRNDYSEGEPGAWHEVGGWASTGGPKWLHAAMCRRAADAQDIAARAVDDDDDE